MGKVRVELLPWVSDLVGVRGSGRKVIELQVADGDTIRGAVMSIASENPRFADAVLDRVSGNLSDGVAVMLNGKFPGTDSDLDTSIKDGDTVTLLAAFSGG